MKRPLKALIVEDNPNDVELLVSELQGAGFELQWKQVQTELAFLAEINNSPDIILSDYSISQFSGLRAARLLQESGLNIPLILVSGTVDEEVVVEAMKHGATDYLLKDRLARLGRAVEHALEEKRLRQERRRMQEQLVLHATALETAGSAVVITDCAGTILWVNPAFSSSSGYTPEEVIGKTPRLLKSGKHDRAFYADFWNTIISGKTWRGEFINRRKNGSTFYDEHTVTPVRSEAGMITHFIAIMNDVTERKKAESELRRREERFRLLIENAADLITVVNGEGIIDFQSPSSERVLGYKPEELMGQSTFRFVHPDDAARVAAVLQQAITDAATHVAAEFRVRHRDGSWRTIQSIGRSIGGDGPGRLVVINSRDCTEQKALEAQLRQAQKMEAFGQLAGGVAHDFNNLLTVISGHAELLLLTAPVDGSAGESLSEIRKAGERASSLTRQLLAFSRQQVLEPRVVDLNTIVTDMRKLLRRLIGEDILLVANLSPDLRPVRVDPGQMDQVIMNLAVNARDAMPRGGKLLIETQNMKLDEANAELQPLVRPGNYVMLAVSDNGGGMGPEVAAHIFEPFFTTKGIGKGTGLGLAVVHGIIKQSEGQITVESEVGRGTTFRIYLPAVQARVSQISDAGFVRTSQGGETIMLVEDEGSLRQLAGAALERLGYKVLKAANGKNALAIITQDAKKIDLLLTDLVMPEMGGRELAKAFGERFPGTKVLYLSGYTADAAMRHGDLEVGTAFLQKPFAMSALAKKVREVLDQG